MSEEIEFDSEDDYEAAGALEEEEVGKAVLFATDWTVGTILDQLDKGRIDISPRFQRRDVWPVSRKSRYIESLMLHLPVPHIVLAEARDKKGQYLVLDGRQRLLSIMQFHGLAVHSRANAFVLRDLAIATRANGYDHASLSEDHDDLLQQLENSAVRCVVVRNWVSNEFLHLLFTRLNTETSRLNAQELRLAAFTGPFVYFVDDVSVASGGLARLFGKSPPHADARMRDAELLLRYFAFRNRRPDYSGPMKPFLDETCVQLNMQWKEQELRFKKQLQEFEHAVEAGYELFGEDFGKKWDPSRGAYTGRQNRAVLDVLLHFLARIPKKDIQAKGAEVRASLERLFEESDAFVSSIEGTARHSKTASERFPLMEEELRKGFKLRG